MKRETLKRSSSLNSLSVSSNGSTWVKRVMPPRNGVDDLAFSILERIDVGETRLVVLDALMDLLPFQYPRTDRRG